MTNRDKILATISNASLAEMLTLYVCPGGQDPCKERKNSRCCACWLAYLTKEVTKEARPQENGIPAYYKGKDGKDVYYIAQNWRLDFGRSNAIKYIIRMGKKTADVEGDCQKAIQSLRRLLENKE